MGTDYQVGPVPAATSFYARYEQPFSTLRRSGAGRPRLTVNDKLQMGQLDAHTLMLLGVSKEEITSAWEGFVLDHWPLMVWGSSPAANDEYAIRHQDGANWTLEAWVEGHEKLDVKDLAYCDYSQVKRKLTFTMREWNKVVVTDGQIQDPSWRFDGSANRSSQLITDEADTPPPGSAVGAMYTGIDQAEIDATVKAANALRSASTNLESALEQMEIGLRVADSHWEGDRAEALMYQLCLEMTIVDAIGGITESWEDFTEFTVRQQRVAKEQDDELRKMVWTEVGIAVVAGLISFGVGTVAKGAAFILRLSNWGRKVAEVASKLRLERAAAANRVLNHGATVTALRATRMGASEAGAAVVVKGATGQELTADELMLRFAFGAGVQGGVDVARFGVKAMGERWGVSFTSRAGRGLPPESGPAVPPPARSPRPPAGSRPSGNGSGRGPGRPGGTPPPVRPPKAPPGGRGGDGGGGGVPGGRPERVKPRNLHQHRDARWGPASRRPDRRTPTVPRFDGQPPVPGFRVIGPSRPPSPLHRPDGPPKALPGDPGQRIGRHFQSENDTARVVAQRGFRIRQRAEGETLPADHPAVVSRRVDPDRSPDFEIEGRLFDNKHIGRRTPLPNIYTENIAKPLSGQAEGVILDMTRNPITNDEIIDLLMKQTRGGVPLSGEVWVRRGDELFPIWPL